MPFAAQHTTDLTQIAIPQPSPNDAEPIVTRVFPSPPVSAGQAQAVIGWTDGAPGQVGFEIWFADGDEWVRAGAAETPGDGDPTPEIVVPVEARLVARVVSGATAGLLKLAFRAPAASPLVEVGSLPGSAEADIAAMRAAVESIDGKVPGSPAQEHLAANDPSAVRLSDGAVFYLAAKAGDNLGADLRVAAAAVADANPVPTATARSIAGPSSPARKLAPTGPAEPIVAGSTPAARYVAVAGDPANSGAVYVAGIGQASTTNTIPIFANDVKKFFLTNANLLECLASIAGQYVRIEVG